MAEEHIVEESHVETYPKLSRLQVSWGAILAGAVTLLAVSLLLWAFSLAIIFSATSPTVESIKSSVVAAWITAIVTTLIGGFVGGMVAGYLPETRAASSRSPTPSSPARWPSSSPSPRRPPS